LMLLHALAVMLDFCLFGGAGGGGGGGNSNGATATSAFGNDGRSNSFGVLPMRRNVVEEAVYGVATTVTMPVRVLGSFVKDVFVGAGAAFAGATFAGGSARIEPPPTATKATRDALLADLGIVLHALVRLWQKGGAAALGDASANEGSFTPDEVHNKYAIQVCIYRYCDDVCFAKIIFC
jgi:hypothetical protein